MGNMLMIGIIAGGALLVMVIIFVILTRSAQKIDLDSVPEGQKPDWIESEIPEETVQATVADGEGITLYDHDPGEDLAAPFAEQIEDILRHQLQSDPEMSHLDVDFGTAPDGGIEFHFKGETYTEIESIPDPAVQEAIKKAIDKFNQDR